MTGHLTTTQIEEYGRQNLSAADLLSVSDHLCGCEACRRRLQRAVDTDGAFFAFRSELFGEAERTAIPPEGWGHPTVTALTGYLDVTLVGEEMQVVTDHLTRCERCALAIDDLRAFRNHVAPTLDREYYPAAVPTPNQSWWRRLAAFMPHSFLRSPALTFGAAVLLVAGSGWLIWHTPQKEGAKQEIVATTPSSTHAVIADLNDGEGRLMLDQAGKLFGADYLPPDYRGLVKETLTGQRLQKSPLLEGLSRPATSLMGSDKEDGEFSVIEPQGKVLIDGRPTFRWSQLDGATDYVVEVYDEGFNLVATSAKLTANSWTASQPLRRGVIYSWQVRATKDGKEFTAPRPPAPQAQFRILDQAKANELVEARRSYASSHLILGLLYAQSGLLDEAEQELRALQKANPTSSLVTQLLANLQAMRR